VISERGRESIAPLIGEVMERARREGALEFDATGEAVGLYLNLLVGDMQIRRVIGREPPLDETTISSRAEQAYERFLRLTSPSGKP